MKHYVTRSSRVGGNVLSRGPEDRDRSGVRRRSALVIDAPDAKLQIKLGIRQSVRYRVDMIPWVIASVIADAAERFSVVTVVGPRQSGKTTLVRALFPDHFYANLERPDTRALATEDPRSVLRDGTENIILDEVQRLPDLLSWVQVFADRENSPGQFVLTGSNQPLLGEAISQSLAGRTSVHRLLPLSMEELAAAEISASRDDLLVNGFLPRLYDASLQPGELYSAYFATYVERDLRQLINVRDLSRFEAFMRLLAWLLQIEIKAAATFSPEMLTHLERFRHLYSDPAGAAVVYSGPRQPPVRGISVCNHADVADVLFGS